MFYQTDNDSLRNNFFGILHDGVLETLLLLNYQPFNSDYLSGFLGFSEEKTFKAIDVLKNILAIDCSGDKLIITKIGSALNYYLKAIFEEIDSENIDIRYSDAEKIIDYADVLRRHFRLYINDRGFDLFIKELMIHEQKTTNKTNLNSFFGLIIALSFYPEFFETHDYSLLPDFAIRNMGIIRHASLICDPPVNFCQGFGYYHNILKEAGYIRGMSTWANPEIASTILEKVRSGTEVDIIISEQLASVLMSSPYIENIEEYRKYDNLNFYITKEIIPAGLTITDKKISLGFFLNDKNTYDSIHDFISSSEESLEWGEDLFDHYMKNSVAFDKYILNFGSVENLSLFLESHIVD